MLSPVAAAGAFFLAAVIGLAVSKGNDGIAAFWPANAVLLSALILCPPARRWDYIWLCVPASVLANASSGSSWALAILFSVSNITTAALAAKILRTLRGSSEAFDSLFGTVKFAIAVGAAVPVGATFAAAGIAYFGGDFFSAWVSWACSDLLGMFLITSVILTSASLVARRPNELMGAPTGVLARSLFIVFASSTIVFSQSQFPLLFVPLAALVLATFRVGLVGAVLGTAIIAFVGTGFMLLARGPISLIAGSAAVQVQFFQFYLAVLFGTCIPLATLLSERAKSAQERIESERRHRRIVERLREVIFETDLAGRWTYLNPAWSILTGRDPGESIGSSFLSVIAMEDRETVLERLTALHRREIDECQQELRFLHTDGGIRWASVRSFLLFDENNKPVGTYGTINDVTERRIADEARIESEQLYKLLADNSNDLIVKLSLHGVRRYVSPASINVLGFTPEEMLGEAAAGTIHPDDRAVVIATCQTLLSGVANPICVYRQQHKNGAYVWLEASYRLIRDHNGAPVEFIATVRDVGRRENAELERLIVNAQLQEANRLLLMAEEMSMIGHWRVDLASGSIFWSNVVCAIHGRPSGYTPTLEEAVEAYHPDDRPVIQAAMDRAIGSGAQFGFEARLLRKDGTWRHVISSGRTEVGPDGSAVGLFGVFQDVTEAHDAAAALEGAGRQLRDSHRLLTMAEAVGRLGHWRIDFSQETMLWSDEVYNIYRLSRDVEPTVENALALYHPDDVQRVREAVARARETNSDYTSQARLLHADGSITHILTRGEVEYDASGAAVGLFGVVQDVTERVEAEAQLKEREARFRLLTEQASDMISLHDVAGKCLFMSPSVRSVLGYEPAEMIGRSPLSMVPQEDRAIVEQLRRKLAKRRVGHVSTVRFRIRHQCGTLVWVEAAARIAEYQDEPRIIVVCRDVTGQVKVEEELQAARVQAEEAMKAKSMFLANMSHEIRTPMNGVIGFTELLLADELSDFQRRRAEMIADSGRAMMRLLNDILDLSKVEAGQMTIAEETFNLLHTLKACMKLVTPALAKKGLEARCEFAPDLPDFVTGDGLRLRQILLNLLGNAAKFTSEGTVTLRASPDGEGTGILIEVADTGIGIAPDRHAAIFEQFVQANGGIAPRFGGTGLGLAISVQLAQLMGGELRLESEEGRGTSFFLALPLASAASPSRITQPPAAEPGSSDMPGGAARPALMRVLVAEDHDVNQLLISDMLKKLGYEPELASDGQQAIAMVAGAFASDHPYAVVLMDMQMPVVDGLEATRRIRATGVSSTMLPIVALTANAYSDDVTACLAVGMQAHLAKPVSLADLDAALRRWAVQPLQAAPPSVSQQFSPKIIERYLARRSETLDALGRMIRSGQFEDAELAEVADLLHKLAGTAAMFGEGALGDQARLLEQGLQSWAGEERLANVAQAFEVMKRVASC